MWQNSQSQHSMWRVNRTREGPAIDLSLPLNSMSCPMSLCAPPPPASFVISSLVVPLQQWGLLIISKCIYTGCWSKIMILCVCTYGCVHPGATSLCFVLIFSPTLCKLVWGGVSLCKKRNIKYINCDTIILVAVQSPGSERAWNLTSERINFIRAT